MMPDEMEAEKNRKMILAQADEIDILKKNVRDLQEQYQSALIHNKTLIEQLTASNNYLKERCNFSDVESHYLDNSIIVTREEV